MTLRFTQQLRNLPSFPILHPSFYPSVLSDRRCDAALTTESTEKKKKKARTKPLCLYKVHAPKIRVQYSIWILFTDYQGAEILFFFFIFMSRIRPVHKNSTALKKCPAKTAE